jgi:predicted solute-binding protein
VRLAAWNIRPFEILSASDHPGVDFVLANPSECRRALDAGEVDVALVEPETVLLGVDRYSVLDGCILASTASFPYATLSLNSSIRDLRSIVAPDPNAQSAHVARILLREAYGLDPSVRGRDDAVSYPPSASAILELGNPDEDPADPARSIDLGREWFELTTRPLVWGLFAIKTERRHAVSKELFDLSCSAAKVSAGIVNWLASEPSIAKREQKALRNDLRFDLDPEVAEGLDELAHYLFYHGHTDDIAQPRFFASP